MNTGPGSDSSTRSAIPQNTKTPVLKKFSDGCPPDGRGALVITGNLKQEKFFSNGKSLDLTILPVLFILFYLFSSNFLSIWEIGLDLDDAAADPDFFLRTFRIGLFSLIFKMHIRRIPSLDRSSNDIPQYALIYFPYCRESP